MNLINVVIRASGLFSHCSSANVMMSELFKQVTQSTVPALINVHFLFLVYFTYR